VLAKVQALLKINLAKTLHNIVFEPMVEESNVKVLEEQVEE
jgi:hypothetical protein